MTQAPQWTPPQADVDPKAAAAAAKAYAKATRPWYKKKRYILGGAVAIVIAISAGSSGGSGSGLTAVSENSTTSETQAPAAPDNTTGSTAPAPAPAAPKYTLSQQNAIESAQSYLSMGTGYSRAGLIGQLSSKAGEGF